MHVVQNHKKGGHIFSCCESCTALIYFQEEGRSVPWKSILTCVPLWAILVTQCGMSWMFYTQLTELPTYMKNVLQFDITQVSIHSSCAKIWGVHVSSSTN